MENVSELIDSLTAILENQARTRITDNMPDTPTAIIYAGSKAYEAHEEIQATLRSVWRGRTDHLCQMVLLEGRYHSPQSDGSMAPLTEDEVQMQIDEMFAQEHSFRGMNGMLLTMLLDTADYTSLEEFRSAYLALDALREQLGITGCEAMKIVLLDESGHGRSQAREIRGYLAALMEAEDNAARSTVILSNRLKNGVLLSGERIRENYALAANLILLANGSNSAFSPKFARMFPLSQRNFLTASYSRIRKPNKKICEILVNTTLSWLETHFNRGDLLTVDDISKKLEITGGQLKTIDRFFQKHILETLPKPNVLEFLPRTGANLENLTVLPFAEYDRQTMGGFEPFYESTVVALYQSDRIRRLFRDAFQKDVQNVFSPKEAARSLTAQTIEQVIQQIRCDGPKADTVAGNYLNLRAKADCSRLLLPICEEVLKELSASARVHIQHVSDIVQEFQHSYMMDVDETLRQYYHTLALDKLDGSLGEQLLATFNRTDLSKRDMLSALYDTISLLFSSDPIFGLPLEQEMTQRMGGNGKQVQLIIQEELTDGLSERTRLQTAIVPELASETILVNQKDENGNTGTFYNYLANIFTSAECLDTGNSNSIEFVQLYAFDAHML